MSSPVTLDKEGRQKVTLTDVSTIESQQLSSRDLLVEILIEMRRMNLQLEMMTDEHVSRNDVEGEMR